MNPESSTPQDPLTEWQTIFNRDIHTMHQLMLLRTRKDDEQSRRQMYPWIKQIADAIVDLEKAVRNLNRYVVEERSQLAQTAILQKSISFQKERLSLINAQVPEEVSQCLGLEQGEEEDMSGDKENLIDQNERKIGERKMEESGRKMEESGKKKKDIKPLPAVESGKPKLMRKQSQTNVKAATKGRTVQRKGSKSEVEIPVIRSVTLEELDSAPQYVKGRLTLEKIQRVTDSLNRIVANKYRLVGKPYRDLSSTEKNTYQDLKDNECDETRGRPFLTESEIKGFGNYRLDSTAKSVINVLRHVGALKHVRGKNSSTILLIN